MVDLIQTLTRKRTNSSDIEGYIFYERIGPNQQNCYFESKSHIRALYLVRNAITGIPAEKALSEHEAGEEGAYHGPIKKFYRAIFQANVVLYLHGGKST